LAMEMKLEHIGSWAGWGGGGGEGEGSGLVGRRLQVAAKWILHINKEIYARHILNY